MQDGRDMAARATGGSGPARGLALLAGLLAILILAAGPAPVQAMPPDPERPFDATNCAEAMARYREALAGSPLISAAEQAEVLARARAQLRRLCGAGADVALPEDPVR